MSDNFTFRTALITDTITKETMFSEYESANLLTLFVNECLVPERHAIMLEHTRIFEIESREDNTPKITVVENVILGEKEHFIVSVHYDWTRIKEFLTNVIHIGEQYEVSPFFANWSPKCQDFKSFIKQAKKYLPGYIALNDREAIDSFCPLALVLYNLIRTRRLLSENLEVTIMMAFTTENNMTLSDLCICPVITGCLPAHPESKYIFGINHDWPKEIKEEIPWWVVDKVVDSTWLKPCAKALC